MSAAFSAKKNEHCLYLHGFLSSGCSAKAAWLRQMNRSDPQRPLGQWHAPTYAQANLLDSVQKLETRLQSWQLRREPFVLIGSSLGGYLAQYLAHQFSAPYVLINPALAPLTLFTAYQGEHRNPYTSEKVWVNSAFSEALAALAVPHLNLQLPSLLLADLADEVVDLQPAIKLYQSLPNAQVTGFLGGNHAFAHRKEAWPLIADFVQRHLNVKIEQAAE
ncbi:MAG: hypothetical protein JXR44_08085 [Thiotrichales bacterium]|nr:hypothetical protein [Thiotrichales bacterium]